MKVLIISDYRDTQAARPEAAMVIGLKQRGVDIEVITYPDTVYEKPFREKGITVHTIHPRKKFDWAFIRTLQQMTREHGYEIFYLFNSQAIINGIFAAYNLPVKVVLYRGYTGNIHWYDPTAYLKYLNPRVDKIVCLAQSIKDYLHGQRFFREKKAVTINKGHDPGWYENIVPADLQEFDIPADAFVLACMGNARPFKGIRYLLEATYKLADLDHLHLLLIGRDMDRGPLRKLIDESPMHARIHATGWRSDVLSILASCHAFVLPSIGGEATTKSLLEAMSMGLAPIMTSIAGNKGVVLHQQQGLVVPPRDPGALADAIRSYYDHPEQVKVFGQAARKHIATRFHTDRTVQETMVLFERLLDVKD